MSNEDFTEVPVLQGFDQTAPIGWLRIRTDALPPTPNFCFSLGFEVLGFHVEAGDVPKFGAYKLKAVSLVMDQVYASYLQRNSTPAQRLDPAGNPKLEATLLEREAVHLLNSVKAWRDGDVSEPFPLHLRISIDALLMMAEIRRTGL
jgi:hypothetical protein